MIRLTLMPAAGLRPIAGGRAAHRGSFWSGPSRALGCPPSSPGCRGRANPPRSVLRSQLGLVDLGLLDAAGSWTNWSQPATTSASNESTNSGVKDRTDAQTEVWTGVWARNPLVGRKRVADVRHASRSAPTGYRCRNPGVKSARRRPEVAAPISPYRPLLSGQEPNSAAGRRCR